MVSLNEYSSLADFDKKRGNALESLLYSDEQFIYGIDVYDALFLSGARASKLVLTDRRVIEFKRGFIKESSKDFKLDDIASIEYDKGYVTRKVTLEGSGISNEYQTLENYGRTFVTSVREQISRNEKGEEPIDTPASDAPATDLDEDNLDPSQAGFTEKFGSIKAHVVVAVLTVWWTVGFGNLVYGAYQYYQFKQLA